MDASRKYSVKAAFVRLGMATVFACSLPATAMTVVGAGLTVSGELVLDANQGLTWLRDTNHAYSNGQVPAGRDPVTWDGRMTWDEAMSWAQSLTVGNATWRLPTRAEMAGLFQQASVRISEPGPFLVSRYTALSFGDAWSSEEGGPTNAWYMDMDVYFSAGGFSAPKTYEALTWGAVMVPEPETYALMLGGLGLVALRARRRR